MSAVMWKIPALVAMLGAMEGARVAPSPFLPEPEMVGAGVISTADDEYAGSLTPDGKTITTTRASRRTISTPWSSRI